MSRATGARGIRVRGVVQGVGFRPFVLRLANAHGVAGWVLNDGAGVEIHVEGAEPAVDAFVRDLPAQAPPAARMRDLETTAVPFLALTAFEIRASVADGTPTTRIPADLRICSDCLRELFDPGDRRYRYPYINCTNCGPRFSIIQALPYDRAETTMARWRMCAACEAEYTDPVDRRFHAQPIACQECGPQYALSLASGERLRGDAAIARVVELLRDGAVVAIKGIGGYHLACDARNRDAVAALRERKFRKEKPFAIMVSDLESARRIASVTAAAERLLLSSERPIVLCPASCELPGIAPGLGDFGVMLPYTPLHHLLFHDGAPEQLVMTSGNRSNEPIAYRDEDAAQRLHGIADAFLSGERPIARRVDDSVVQLGPVGSIVVRRSRGYAPATVAALQTSGPILALGADLKNSITLVTDGEACVSQHIGDLEQYGALEAFRETVRDLMDMYRVAWDAVTVAHDLHPHYVSTSFASTLRAKTFVPVQHHRAHLASVLAEHGAVEERVIGVVFDGTGYGDDGTIWGGEFFAGTLRGGFTRVAALRSARLAGGDAAARLPAQAAAGFLWQLDDRWDLTRPPFSFPQAYLSARVLLARDVRVFATTSTGRLFDAVAAIAGFDRPISYEGQAAIWLEHLARASAATDPYPMTFDGLELDWRPALAAALADRAAGTDPADSARRFHLGLADGTADAVRALASRHAAATVAVSGGVFQNRVLLTRLLDRLADDGLHVLVNSAVPPNDGGISLGQAAVAAMMQPGSA